MPEDSLTPHERLREDWRQIRRVASLFITKLAHSTRIWRELLTAKNILGWDFVGWWVAIFIGGGLALLGLPSSPLHLGAEICFALAALIMFAKVIQIAVIGDYSFPQRAVFTAVLFSLFGILLVEAIHAVEKSRSRSTATGKAQPPSGGSLPDYTKLQLVVNAAINWKKEFRMANNGEIPIYDIEVRGTEYLLNETALGQARIEIEFFHVHGGKPDFGIQQLGAHQWTPVYDLAQNFKFVDFPKNDDKDRPDMSEWVRRHYVLRITFRDARDGLRYVSYKAVSGIRGIEMYENRLTAGETGGLDRQLDAKIPEVLINHQRSMFPLAAFEKEYALPQ